MLKFSDLLNSTQAAPYCVVGAKYLRNTIPLQEALKSFDVSELALLKGMFFRPEKYNRLQVFFRDMPGVLTVPHLEGVADRLVEKGLIIKEPDSAWSRSHNLSGEARYGFSDGFTYCLELADTPQRRD